MAEKLTDKRCESAQAPAGKRAVLWDSVAPGLGLRVGARAKVWVVAYRLGGRPVMQTIGAYGQVSLADARKAARAALGKLDQHEDPRRHVADVVPAAARESLESVVRDYIRLHVDVRLKPGTARQYRGRLEVVIRTLGHKPVTLVSRRDLLDLTEGLVAEGKPAQAAYLHRLLSALFAWAAERGVVPVSPLTGVRPPAKVRPRDRVLTDDELVAVWKAAGQVGYPYGTLARLLVLTGQREGEVVGLRRDQLEGATWTMPDTKRGTPHRITLPPLAVHVLSEAPQFEGPYVLTTREGAAPLNGLSKAKERLDRHISIAPWRWHDLRRTCASGMARLGTAPHIIEAVLNHRSGVVSGIARVYNVHNYESEGARALASWARHVERLVTGGSRKVVEMRS